VVDPSFKSGPNSTEGVGHLLRAKIQDKYDGGGLFVAVYKRKKQGGLAKQDYDVGLDPSGRYDGMNEDSVNPQDIPESTGPTPTHVFPDTKEGALASFIKGANKRFVKKMDLPNCLVHADPQVEGVWAIDNFKTGVRVIIYLAGYREPGGRIRGPFDDFEDGKIPEREMKRHRRNDQAQDDVEDDMMYEGVDPLEKLKRLLK
jgi:hypothetical protein